MRVAVVDAGGMPARSIAARGADPDRAHRRRDRPRRPRPELDDRPRAVHRVGAGQQLGHRRPARRHPGVGGLRRATRTRRSRRPPVLDGAAAEPAPARATRSPVIRLLGCPPDLLLAHDDNLADIARELSLFGASHADPDAVRLRRADRRGGAAVGAVVGRRAAGGPAGPARAPPRRRRGDRRDRAPDLPRKVRGAAPRGGGGRGDGRARAADHDDRLGPRAAVAGLGRGRDDRAGHHRRAPGLVPRTSRRR